MTDARKPASSPFLAEHARDPAHLLDELDRACEIDRCQHRLGAIAVLRAEQS